MACKRLRLLYNLYANAYERLGINANIKLKLFPYPPSFRYVNRRIYSLPFTLPYSALSISLEWLLALKLFLALSRLTRLCRISTARLRSFFRTKFLACKGAVTFGLLYSSRGRDELHVMPTAHLLLLEIVKRGLLSVTRRLIAARLFGWPSFRSVRTVRAEVKLPRSGNLVVAAKCGPL
jgi:hypothetical protein